VGKNPGLGLHKEKGEFPLQHGGEKRAPGHQKGHAVKPYREPSHRIWGTRGPKKGNLSHLKKKALPKEFQRGEVLKKWRGKKPSRNLKGGPFEKRNVGILGK